ncbi:MAG: thioredoxin family protein [Deltaproteobacteria bacterium]|nr:thioredoxin family protein [Deltaproteobacteria bacterium]
MATDDFVRISLGRFQVGLTGLKEAIAEVRASGLRSEADIAQALLEKLRVRNYIPASAEEEYKKAFLREYKKASGEELPEERHGLSIRILGPGCPNCEALMQSVMAVLTELNLPAAVEHVRDLNEILALGVWSTPALLINDKVMAVGRLPNREMLKNWLMEAGAQ